MNRKILRTLAASVFIGSMLVTTAYAENAVVTGSEVNLRSGPGTGYRVVGSLSRGTVVSVIDRSDDYWYAVDFYGDTCFMSANYLRITDDEEDYAEIADDSAEGTGYINAMYVRFRSGPGSGYAVLGTYNKGKMLQTVGRVGDWTACVIDGERGYVYSSYVSDTYVSPSASGSYDEDEFGGGGGGSDIPTVGTGGAVIQPEPSFEIDISKAEMTGNPLFEIQIGSTSTPAPTPTPAPSSTPVFEIPLNPSTPTPAPTPTPTSTPAPTPTPAPSSTPVFEIPISSSTPTPTPALTPTPTPAPTPTPGSGSSENAKGFINGDYVRFRTGPGTTYSIIDLYNRGKELTIISEVGEWTACIIDGERGYVYSAYVLRETKAEINIELPSQTTQPTSTPSAAPSEIPGAEEEQPAATEAPQPSSVPSKESPGYITGNNVRFRSGPSMSSGIICELFFGNKVTITGFSGEWTAVIYNGEPGFVYSAYVKEGEYEYTDTTSGAAGTVEGKAIADYALQFVGYNYCWGGTSPSTGFDCSGLVYYVYGQFGYSLNRVAADQARNGVHVDELEPGDILCFYSGGSYIGHVGIYIGGGKFVHAANSALGVIVSSLEGYYENRGYEARRIV